ncbi:MAG: hypothetical protein H0U57_13550 [Tatlockia sp.]|nr:hypothetical protein [Tatlockia sp.]
MPSFNIIKTLFVITLLPISFPIFSMVTTCPTPNQVNQLFPEGSSSTQQVPFIGPMMLEKPNRDPVREFRGAVLGDDGPLLCIYNNAQLKQTFSFFGNCKIVQPNWTSFGMCPVGDNDFASSVNDCKINCEGKFGI